MTIAFSQVNLVISIIKNWQADPIITTIENTDHSLNEIDFPAVTICPVGKKWVQKRL